MKEKISYPVWEIKTQISTPTKQQLKVVFEDTQLPILEKIFQSLKWLEWYIKTNHPGWIQADGLHYILDQIQEYWNFEIQVEWENSQSKAKFLTNILRRFSDFENFEIKNIWNKIIICDPEYDQE